MEVIRKARESGHPIVYLPVHRSHVDYVLVSWVLVACNIRAPLVAAGDNLNIPIFRFLFNSIYLFMGILAASGTVAGQPIRIYILNSLTQLSTLQFTHEKRWRLFHKAQVRL